MALIRIMAIIIANEGPTLLKRTKNLHSKKIIILGSNTKNIKKYVTPF